MMVSEPEIATHGRLPFRIRIGITGHRHLADETAVQGVLTDAMRRIAEWLPETGATPNRYTIVSSLADGADRLAVGAARDAFGSRCELEAVLPLEQADYETDFDDTSRTRFRTLLEEAHEIIVSPELESRDAAYEHAGRYAVNTSDIIVAVWDGKPARGRGGTADTVDYAELRGVPCVVIDPTAVAPAAMPSTAPVGLKPLRDARTQFDEFNRAEIDSKRLGELHVRERREFLDAVGESSIHWACHAVADWSLPSFARADELAIRYQRRYSQLGGSLFAASALSVTAVAAQIVYAPKDTRWGVIEVALMLFLLLGFLWGRRARLHDRWIDYRSIAEAFRAAPFIALTGWSGPTNTEPGGSRHWFQRAFSEHWRDRPEIAVPESEAPELGRVLVDGWISGQIAYHQKAIRRFHRAHDLMSRWMVGLFAVAFLIAAMHVLHVTSNHFLEDLFTFLAVALPGFGAAATGIRDQRQYRRHAERSKRTVERLEPIRRHLATATSSAAIARLAIEAQSLIAAETLDWSSVIEFQDVEMIL